VHSENNFEEIGRPISCARLLTDWFVCDCRTPHTTRWTFC